MNVTELLCRLMDMGKMPAAIMLEGSAASIEPHMKAVFGHWFCRTHNNCGLCDTCALYQNDNLPDFHVIAPQTGHAIKIEQVRELQEISRQTSQILDFQVVLIQHADTMNTFAANALLKLLEEPIKQFFFVLTVENAKFLPLTVRSRCWLLKIDDANAFVSEAKQVLMAKKQAFKDLLIGFVSHQVDLAQMLKAFEAHACDDVLWLLQMLAFELIEGLTLSVKQLGDAEFNASIAVPLAFWWRFWDGLVEARQMYRTQVSLQANLLLSRLLLILHG